MAEKIDYLFIPSNDSQAEWMLPISNLLLNAKFMIFESRRENSSELLNSYLTDYISYEPGILENLQPSMVILGNDWGFEELLILLEANSLSIKSVCIQDGAIIYPDRVRRLLNSDFLLAFGKKTLDYFPHPNAYLTGNPKFDRYYLASIPEKPKVMINYNFTYGIYTDFGKQWLQDVISVLDDLKIEGFISIHPRTFISNEWAGNYEIIKSSDIPLTDQIYRSSIVISRFSTVIYEAIASGRKVIYYNPHHENFDLFKGGYKDIIIETSSKEDLKHLMLDHHNSKNDINIKDWNEFIRHHLTTIDRNSAFLCAKSLMEILNKSTGGLMHQEKSQILSRELVRSSLYFYRDFVGMQRSLISKNEYQLFNDRKRGLDYINQLLININYSKNEYEKEISDLKFDLRDMSLQIAKQSQIITQLQVINQNLTEFIQLQENQKGNEINELKEQITTSFLTIPPASTKTFIYLAIRSFVIRFDWLRNSKILRKGGKTLKQIFRI